MYSFGLRRVARELGEAKAAEKAKNELECADLLHSTEFTALPLQALQLLLHASRGEFSQQC